MASTQKKRYIHEGWINKWTNFIGSWRPRYFMLEPEYLMYSTDKDGIVKESFLLSQCKIRLCPDDPVRLDIEVVGVGLLCLRTDTPLEKHKWYVSFKRAQKLLFQSYQKRISIASEVNRSVNTSDLPGAEASKENPIVETVGSHEIEDTLSNELVVDKVNENLDGEDVNLLETNLYDLNNLFIKTRIGHEPKTSLSFILDNAVTLNNIANKLISDLNKTVPLDLRKKLDSLRAVVSNFCSSTELLYTEEVQNTSELERSLYLLTKKGIDSEDSVQPLDESTSNKCLNEIYPQRSLTSEMDYIAGDSEFYECEDIQRTSIHNNIEDNEFPINASDNLDNHVPEDDTKHIIAPHIIKRRTVLPTPRTELKINIWSILKDLIGKDLSRISMPIVLNEPTSSLQRASEDFEYCKLLTTAANENDPVNRMAYVTVFGITPYSSTVGRTYKPFNPLLGETYELSHRGFNFIAEQVAHHPPITAFHCFNDYFESYGTTNALVNFTGKSIEVSILGPFIVNLKLGHSKESYSIQRSYVLVHNIIFGKMWIEAVGTTITRNKTGGEFSVVQYLKKGWFDKEIHKVRALVYNKYGVPKYYITGIWSKYLFMEEVRSTNSGTKKILKEDGSLDFSKSLYKNEDDAWDAFVNEIDWDNINVVPNSKREVWRPNERPVDNEKYYGFGYITLELNEITEDYDRSKGAVIPITDSRGRPDQRAYENGEIEFASKEKRRLEEKQRKAAKSRADAGLSYKPMWFNKVIDPITHQANWIFNGKYWDKKADGTINEGVPDIFG